MGLDELRARLDSLLAGQGLSSDHRARASGLHAALVELKVAVGQSRDALAAAERRHLRSESGKIGQVDSWNRAMSAWMPISGRFFTPAFTEPSSGAPWMGLPS